MSRTRSFTGDRDELDLTDLSPVNFKIRLPVIKLDVVVVAASIVVTVVVVDDDDDDAVVVVLFDGMLLGVVVIVVALVVALKHFWHMLLVAGFPVKPQLLTHRVKASGTLNSVSSFSVFCAISFIVLMFKEIEEPNK